MYKWQNHKFWLGLANATVLNSIFRARMRKTCDKIQKMSVKNCRAQKTDEEQKKEIMKKNTYIIFLHWAVCYRFWIIQISGRQNCRQNSLWYDIELEWAWAICWRAKKQNTLTHYTQILGMHKKALREKKNIYTWRNVNIELSRAI